jgi:hypothetical protein
MSPSIQKDAISPPLSPSVQSRLFLTMAVVFLVHRSLISYDIYSLKTIIGTDIAHILYEVSL